MISDSDLSLLMWQCAYVYALRREAGLSEREIRVLRSMRFYFRADERPPQALATRALGIVSTYKASQGTPTRRLKIVEKRKARRNAVDAKLLKEQERLGAERRAAWRAELHKEAFQ